MNFWRSVIQTIDQGNRVMLMVVLHSDGSSPGRQGFKMVVSEDGTMAGSIGGGFMEHKLVELCRRSLNQDRTNPFIKRQVHRSNIPADRSGMICSGEQTIAFYELGKRDVGALQAMLTSWETGQGVCIELDPKGVQFIPASPEGSRFTFTIEGETSWSYREDLQFNNTVHIVGGGHVGLALSRTMNQLGFIVHIYDDRERLNTMEANMFAHLKELVDYEEIDKYIPEGPQQYVVIMTFGYRSDDIVLRALLGGEFAYLGMMGSTEKVAKMMRDLKTDGIAQGILDKVYSPIGVPVHSKTPEEIAVSIAAEIIRVKNGC